MKPIIFNTDMVKAILDGRKTVTRRVDKPLTSNYPMRAYEGETPEQWLSRWNHKPPYYVGDILWVRETWAHISKSLFQLLAFQASIDDGEPCDRFVYKASDEAIDFELIQPDRKWRPSIHMPREAARLFLRVTDVMVERLQEITEEGATKEGFTGLRCPHSNSVMGACSDCMNTGWLESPIFEFYDCWESIYAKRGQGWDANPWVWVIEFEVCEKPEGF